MVTHPCSLSSDNAGTVKKLQAHQTRKPTNLAAHHERLATATERRSKTYTTSR